MHIEDFISDNQIIEKLSHPENTSIMVIGGIDTGKTTLVGALADFFSTLYETGIVDLDMGQSRIGPPTTMAWGMLKGGFSSWENIEVQNFYFTGTLSPPGSMLPVLVGAKMITDIAKKHCRKIIIDTTGLITEPYGRVIKQYKIDLISPQVVIGLEREKELSSILQPYAGQRFPRIIRIPVPPSVSCKNPNFRANYRLSCFKSYFHNARLLKQDAGRVALRFTRDRVPLISDRLLGRIVCFRDKSHRDLALGIIEEVDNAGPKLLIKTPLESGIRYTTLVIGTVRLKNYKDLEY